MPIHIHKQNDGAAAMDYFTWLSSDCINQIHTLIFCLPRIHRLQTLGPQPIIENEFRVINYIRQLCGTLIYISEVFF